MPTAPYTLEQAEEDIANLRGQATVLSEYAEIATLVVAGVVVAQQPGTATEPQTQESWHLFSPLSNSWSIPTNGYAKYRITPQNELQISAWILSPGSGTVNAVTIATFPSAYRPASKHGFPVGADAANAVTTGQPNALMTLFSTGVLQSNGISVGSNVYIEVKIPLDV